MIIEKLVIENFAGLKYIDIEIKKINVLIGPQASGKSVIAKILFYCKGLIEEIFSQGINLKEKRVFDREIKNKFKQYFPFDSWGGKSFSICYYIGEEYIKIKASETNTKKSTLIIEYSDFYKNSLKKVREASRLIQKNIEEIENSRSQMFARLELIGEYKEALHLLRYRACGHQSLRRVTHLWQ